MFSYHIFLIEVVQIFNNLVAEYFGVPDGRLFDLLILTCILMLKNVLVDTTKIGLTDSTLFHNLYLNEILYLNKVVMTIV